MKKTVFSLFFLFLSASLFAQYTSKVWIADLGNGRYRNPVLYADYPDPDVCRVEGDFYMVSSSYGMEPGLPLLHSKDLVNWKSIGFALKKLTPKADYINVNNSNGPCTPSLKYHKGVFYIYYSVPESGIYMIKTTDISNNWEDPVLIMEGKGLMSPCPIWNADGSNYLLYTLQDGIKDIVLLATLDESGTKVTDEGVVLYDGHETNAGLAGVKIMKKDDSYYIFAAGKNAKSQGFLLTLRSKNILGPYEEKVSMFQAETNFYGPYNGSYVEMNTAAESWYINAQYIPCYGSTVMLNPVKWENGWPVIGDKSKSPKPILNAQKPSAPKTFIETPFDSDEFDGDRLGYQWQWNAGAKPYWYYLNKNDKRLRLYSQPVDKNIKNLWNVPNLLLQRLPAGNFTMTAKIKFMPNAQLNGEKAGIILYGTDYAAVCIEKAPKGFYLYQQECINANEGTAETENQKTLINQNEIYIRVKMKQDSKCVFSYSLDGSVYYTMGKEFTIKTNEVLGARIGLFAIKPATNSKDSGWLDVEKFVFEK